MNPSEQPATQTNSEGVLLLLQVPRTNDKKELAAEQMFASLQNSHADFKMCAYRRRNGDCIDFGIAQKVMKIGRHLYRRKSAPDQFQLFGVGLGNEAQFHASNFREVSNEIRAPVAIADYADLYHLL